MTASTSEAAALLRDYDRMKAEAGGWVSAIPAEERAEWERRKEALLGRGEERAS